MSKNQQWLQVNSEYSGIDTNGLVVRVGTYKVGAPELYGASYSLVEHGSAEWVDAPEVVEVVEDVIPFADGLEDESEETNNFEELTTNAQLKAYAEERGIDIGKARSRAEIIAAIEAGE